MDALERRGLVRRRRCATDSRAVEAHLTDEGVAVVRAAEAAHAAAVRERFLDQLSGEEVAVLARVFRRFAPQAAEACAVVDAERDRPAAV
jgi:DNA-binding MarR family transcriptional regulator